MRTLGETLSLLIAYNLFAVLVFDIRAKFDKTETVSSIICRSWLAWPVGVMAAFIVGVIMLSHFTSFPER
jgi:hypothetical protein